MTCWLLPRKVIGPDELCSRLDVQLIAFCLEQLGEDSLNDRALGCHCQRTADDLVAQHVLAHAEVLQCGRGASAFSDTLCCSGSLEEVWGLTDLCQAARARVQDLGNDHRVLHGGLHRTQPLRVCVRDRRALCARRVLPLPHRSSHGVIADPPRIALERPPKG